MPNALRAVAALLLMVIGFTLYPMYRSATVADRMAEQIARNAMTLFVDTVRSKGYLDVRDYEIFEHQMTSSGMNFSITLEYYKRDMQPVYTDPNNPATFQNTFTVDYAGYFNKDLLDVLYPGAGSTLPPDDTSRRYDMHEGDLFNVRAVSKGVTLSDTFHRLMFHTGDVPIVITYGGMIRNEAP